MKVGKWPGTLKDCGMKLTQAGDPQVVLLFEVNVDGAKEDFAWYGSLKNEKSQEITIKALLTCGFKGNSPEDTADGMGCFEIGVPVVLSVEENEYQGKKSLKIAWVNSPGGNLLDEKISKANAIQKTSGMNLSGKLAAMRLEQSKKQPGGLPF